MILGRRSFLTGLGAMLAAPAIVKASSLMPVRAIRPDLDIYALLAKHVDAACEVLREQMDDAFYSGRECRRISFNENLNAPYASSFEFKKISASVLFIQ